VEVVDQTTTAKTCKPEGKSSRPPCVVAFTWRGRGECARTYLLTDFVHRGGGVAGSSQGASCVCVLRARTHRAQDAPDLGRHRRLRDAAEDTHSHIHI